MTVRNPFAEIRELLGDGEKWIKKKAVEGQGENVKYCLTAAACRTEAANPHWAVVRNPLKAAVARRYPFFLSLTDFNDRSEWEVISEVLYDAEMDWDAVH